MKLYDIKPATLRFEGRLAGLVHKSVIQLVCGRESRLLKITHRT